MASPKYAPRHRGAPHRRVRTSVKNVAVASSVAAAATGIAVSTGVLSSSASPFDGAAIALGSSNASATDALTPAELDRRVEQASRSSDDRRQATDVAKTAALADATGTAVVHTEDLTNADPRTLTKALMPQFGMDPSQFSCIDRIWTQESNWNIHAENPGSGAYGIPQALPGSKMASAGANWQNSAETQIKWGLGYIKNRYGSACSAWSFKAAHGWY